MNIGIIGAGAIGSCLAAKFVQQGHQVSIANSRGPASLQPLAANIGAEAVTVSAATQNKQVIIVTIPQKSIPHLPKDLFKQLSEEVVVIDTGNYYPNLRDGIIPELIGMGIDSLWVQEQLGVPVIKVFNSISAESLNDLGKPKGEKSRIALAVSGDSTAAKSVVSGLVEALGFDPADVGDIHHSWRQQPGSAIYCRDIPLEELQKRVAAMEPTWTTMHDVIIGKRNADEVIMRTDYPAYLRSLQD